MLRIRACGVSYNFDVENFQIKWNSNICLREFSRLEYLSLCQQNVSKKLKVEWETKQLKNIKRAFEEKSAREKLL